MATEIFVKTFNDYKETVIDEGKVVRNEYYPDYSYWGHDHRNSLVNPSTILIHSMCAPAETTADGIESTDPYACKNLLEKEKFSAHYLIPEFEIIIDNNGVEKLVVYQMIQDDRKAWHAGESRLPNLGENEEARGLNHSSIGIELLHKHDGTFTDHQYMAVVGLVVQLLGKGYPIENILGHNEVAGDDVRGAGEGKTDPEGFDWDRFMMMLASSLNITDDEVARFRARVA